MFADVLIQRLLGRQRGYGAGCLSGETSVPDSRLLAARDCPRRNRGPRHVSCAAVLRHSGGEPPVRGPPSDHDAFSVQYSK